MESPAPARAEPPVLDLVVELGTAAALLFMAWWRQGAFGVLYAAAAVAQVLCCSATRALAQAHLRLSRERFASARDEDLAAAKAYEFERRRSPSEARVWRLVTAAAWLDVALQSALQLVLRVGTEGTISGRARAVLEALGFRALRALGFLYMYGAILLLLMPLAYVKHYLALRRERQQLAGSGSQASGPTAARCRAAHDLVEGFFAAASVSAAVVWPSAFGLVYLLTGAVAFVGKFDHRWSPACRSAHKVIVLLCATPACAVHLGLLFASQVQCGGPGSCVLGTFGQEWQKRLGIFFVYAAGSSMETRAFQCAEIALVSLTAILSVYLACPVSWARAKSRTRGTSLSTSLGVSFEEWAGSPLREPLLGGAGEAEGLRRDMWDFGSESEYSEAFLSSWMYFGNVCACCLIVVTPSLLTNLLLLFALVNVFLIQHQRPQVFSMGRMGQFFCALVLMASYCGSVFACSERGVLAFVGLHCIRGVSYRSFVLAVEVGLVLLYSTFGHVARNTVRGSEEGGVFVRQPETPGILEKKSSIAAEATLVARISWLGLLLAAHLANSLWISVHRVNAVSYLFSVALWAHLSGLAAKRNGLGDWLVMCQSFSMLYLVVLTLCDNAMLLFVFQGRTKDILTNLGLISSSPLTDVFPFVSLIFLNLLLQHAKAWCGGLLDEERVQTLRVWRAGQRCLRWTSAAIQYLLTAGLLTGVFVLGQTRIAACCNDYFNFLGLGYLTITCFHFVGSWNGRASRAAWTATQWLAFGDYTLQILSWSRNFGTGSFDKRIQEILVKSVGCVDPGSSWPCFLSYLCRPLAIVLLLKLRRFCAIHSNPESAVPQDTFEKRLVVRHGSKLVAVCTMAVCCRVGGVAGLGLVATLLAFGISPRSPKKYAMALCAQTASMAILSLQYCFRIGCVEDIADGIKDELVWIGVWQTEESTLWTRFIITAAILSCHILILGKEWEGVVMLGRGNSVHCALFDLGSVEGLSTDRSSLRTQVSTPTSVPVSSEIEIAGQPRILPRYMASPSEFRSPSSCPENLHGEPILDRQATIAHLFMEEETMSERGLSEIGSARSPMSERPADQGADLQIERQRLQVACAVTYLKYVIDFVPVRGMLLAALVVSSAVCSQSFLSLVFLVQIATLMLTSERRGEKRLKILVGFEALNTALLLYSCLVTVIFDSPWVPSVSCGTSKVSNIWYGLCSDAKTVWSAFFCVWLTGEYRRVCSLRESARNEAKALLLHQMNTLFFCAEHKRTRVEKLFWFVLFHSMDFSLFCITAISLVNIDVFHLGYFGLSLLYMRCRRDFLRGKLKRLWWVIVVYNFCVIATVVAYQAPWSALVPAANSLDSPCSPEHVLGLYRITDLGRQAFRVQNGGLALDVAIFFVVIAQLALLHTKAFQSLVLAHQREKHRAVQEMEDNYQLWREQEVKRALVSREHLRARKKRVEWLKRGLLNSKRGSVDVKLGNDKYFSSIKTPGEPLSESLESMHLEDSMEPLYPFTCESPKFPLLSESLNKVSTTGKLLRQFLENLRRWVMGSVLDRRVRQRDTDSFVVYLLLILTFLHEFSLVTAAFPLVLYSFALVSPGAKSLRFWNLIFYYCEIVLSLRYCFWIPFVHRCPHFEAGTCEELRESPRDWWLLLLGIQPKPFPHSIPFMLLYLSIAWHHGRVAQVAKVYKLEEEQFAFANAFSVKAKLSHVYWLVHNYLTKICYKSEHASRMPFVIHVSLSRPRQGPPWHERPLDEVGERIFQLYSHRTDDRMRQRAPNLCRRLEGVDASFTVKSVEQVLDQDVDEGVNLYDVVILEVTRITLSSERRLLKPVSDIARALKLASDVFQAESAKEESSGVEIYDDAPSDFAILDAEALVGEERDFYVPILCSDIAAFIFVVIFYQACFSAREKSFTTTFSLKSVFPAGYIYALVSLFMLIVVDRAIYVLGANGLKTAYHFATLAFFLGYVLTKYWGEEMRTSRGSGSKELEIQVFFALKAVSLAFSSKQIKAGFPTNTLGHWLLRRRSVFNQVLHVIYTFTPFLPELRMMLDWTCTETTLQFFDWLRVEEIRHSLFRIEMRNMFRQKGVGLKQPWYTKMFQGFLGFLVLALIIWGPLILYSSSNPAIVTPGLTGISANLTLEHDEGSFPLFSGGQDRTVRPWDRRQEYFGKTFADRQVREVLLSPYSDGFWTVSPPRRREIQATLANATGRVRLKLDFLLRKSFPVTAQDCTFSVTRQLSEKSLEGLTRVLDGRQDRVPLSFKNAFEGNGTDFYNLFVQLGGNLQVCEANPVFSTQNRRTLAVGCSLGLSRLSGCDQGVCEWWELLCDEGGAPASGLEVPAKPGVLKGPKLVLVFEKTIGDSVMSSLFASRGGLIGLYVSFVLVIGRLIHASFSSGLREKIWVNELPATDKLKSILDDLDAARAEKALAVEEELYWGLVRIFRSPAVLFELTKKRS